MPELSSLVTPVPDFPTPGILFRDITPLLLDAKALDHAIHELAQPFREARVDAVAAIESRGFIFGAPLARELGCGLIPVRKLGKLPRPTVSRSYSLEYGENHLEMHVDAVEPGQTVLLVDDVLATGGTARAAAEIIEECGAEIAGIAFLIELAGLNGREALDGRPVHSVITYG